MLGFSQNLSVLQPPRLVVSTTQFQANSYLFFSNSAKSALNLSEPSLNNQSSLAAAIVVLNSTSRLEVCMQVSTHWEKLPTSTFRSLPTPHGMTTVSTLIWTSPKSGSTSSSITLTLISSSWRPVTVVTTGYM